MEKRIKLFERRRRKELSHKCGVYAIFVNGHIYVGSSKQHRYDYNGYFFSYKDNLHPTRTKQQLSMEGFDENTSLIEPNDNLGIGSSTYLVSKEWLESLGKENG